MRPTMTITATPAPTSLPEAVVPRIVRVLILRTCLLIDPTLMKLFISLWLSFRVASENAGLYEGFGSLDLVSSARRGKPHRAGGTPCQIAHLLYRSHHKRC